MESVQALVDKLHIDLEVGKIEDKELLEANYILIRHAYSDYNYKAQLIVE